MNESMAVLREEVQALIAALHGCVEQSCVNHAERVIGLARVMGTLAEVAHRDVSRKCVGVHRTLDELSRSAFAFVETARAAGVGVGTIPAPNPFNTSEV